jgi:ATP-dependent DNA ligase
VQIGNTVSVTSNFQINKNLYVQGEEYANLREFYNQVISKQAEQIVLKKK